MNFNQEVFLQREVFIVFFGKGKSLFDEVSTIITKIDSFLS